MKMPARLFALVFAACVLSPLGAQTYPAKPVRLIVPFRYGARSIKAITDIQFTATSFAPAKPWAT